MVTTMALLVIIILFKATPTSIDVVAMTALLTMIAYRYDYKGKHDAFYYIGALVLAMVCLFIPIPYIDNGLIGFGMLHVVMLTGVLPPKWPLTKKLLKYRRRYSILGVILSLPHAYGHLFIDKEVNLFGVAALVIMVPLFITSFKVIRREMKGEEWVKLHKLAYVTYILLFAHLIMVADWLGKVIYAVLMTLYINNKLVKEFRK